MTDDLISRSALKKAIKTECNPYGKPTIDFESGLKVLKIIDNAPTVEPTFREVVAYECGQKSVERPQVEWIPVKYRPLNVDERIAFADYYGIEYSDTIDEKAFDCPMPEDGQEILISTSWGVVEDVADNDIDGEGFICYGLENHGDWDGVDAWMPKPEPYKEANDETN